MKPKTLFGEFFKQKRIERGYTLRKLCEIGNLDPGNMSKMERGLLKPPSSPDILERYASLLGIERGSDDWHELFNRAAACRGEVPLEIYENEELVAKLPIIFRTIQGKKVSPELLEELAEIIRNT
jgi:transcriptional regulator with XRE-family HTH domain